MAETSNPGPVLKALEAVARAGIEGYVRDSGRVVCNGRDIFPETFSSDKGLLPALVWWAANNMVQYGEQVAGIFRSPVFVADQTAFTGYVLTSMEEMNPAGRELSACPAVLLLSDFLRNDLLRVDRFPELDITDLVDAFKAWASSAQLGSELNQGIVFSTHPAD